VSYDNIAGSAYKQQQDYGKSEFRRGPTADARQKIEPTPR